MEFAESVSDDAQISEDYFIIEEFEETVEDVAFKEESRITPEQSVTVTDPGDYKHIACLGVDENTNEPIFHCALCNTTFFSVNDHIIEAHGSGEQYQSLLDDMGHMEATIQTEFDETDQVVEEIGPEDIDIKTETSQIACQNCNLVFQTIEDAESHQCLSEISYNSDYTCSICNEVFDSVDAVAEHGCMLNEVKPELMLISCPDCPDQFFSRDLFQKHKKNVHKPEIQNTTHCDVCNTTFKSAKNLKLHSKMHSIIPTKTIRDAVKVDLQDVDCRDQFYCEICNKSFDHGLLNVHQKMHQKVKSLNCSICNKKFDDQISYDMHLQLHTDQPPRVRAKQGTKPGALFPCNYCDREFLRPHEKVKHERVHTGERPHECEVCGKCFRVSYSLTLHLRTHTDIRPFVCTKCNKRFKSYAVYAHHLNTHSEERPYKCPMCPKSFRTSVQLCGHKNSHTKPYNCPQCNRPFASSYAVKMHMATHNRPNKLKEGSTLQCKVCGAQYARTFALQYHMKELHPDSLTTNTLQNTTKPSATQSHNPNGSIFNDDEISAQAIIQGEEKIADNFHTEEIITDWLK